MCRATSSALSRRRRRWCSAMANRSGSASAWAPAPPRMACRRARAARTVARREFTYSRLTLALPTLNLLGNLLAEEAHLEGEVQVIPQDPVLEVGPARIVRQIQETPPDALKLQQRAGLLEIHQGDLVHCEQLLERGEENGVERRGVPGSTRLREDHAHLGMALLGGAPARLQVEKVHHVDAVVL